MEEIDGRNRRLNPVVIALLGVIAILLALLWYFSGNRNPDQDKLSNPQIEQTAISDSAKRCSARSTYELITRELFRRAAEVRGSNQAAYNQLSQVASLRVENPVLESEEGGALNCSGTFYLDLPPGLAVVGGRRSLMANIDYTIEARGNVVLRNADTIIGPLATLARVAAPAPSRPEPSVGAPEENVAASESANVEPGPATDYPGRPSFDCARAQTRGEIAVCSDSGLAELDVKMARQYRRALIAASPAQLKLLQTTRNRFLAYRDRCPDRMCIANAYLGRMREIRDILEDRLQP